MHILGRVRCALRSVHEMHRITGLLPTGALIPSSTAAAYTLAMATAAAQAAQAAQLTQRFQQAAAVAQAAQGNPGGNYSAFTGAPTGAYYIPGTSQRTASAFPSPFPSPSPSPSPSTPPVGGDSALCGVPARQDQIQECRSRFS